MSGGYNHRAAAIRRHSAVEEEPGKFVVWRLLRREPLNRAQVCVFGTQDEADVEVDRLNSLDKARAKADEAMDALRSAAKDMGKKKPCERAKSSTARRYEAAQKKADRALALLNELENPCEVRDVETVA